jgi:hypothetical protein
MKWLIVALLLFPNGDENVIHNQQLSFSDKESCREYVMINANLFRHGINVYLNSMFGYNHEVKIQSVHCEKEKDPEKKKTDDYLNDLMK